MRLQLSPQVIRRGRIRIHAFAVCQAFGEQPFAMEFAELARRIGAVGLEDAYDTAFAAAPIERPPVAEIAGPANFPDRPELLQRRAF